MNILQGLKTYFGFDHFRPLQEEIVRTIVEGKDCLAILPTGGGKSLCFQLPGLLRDGTVIVISPLISLMTDQVEHLLKKGISAVAVHSSLSDAEKRNVRRDILAKNYKFIYVSPETLASRWFIEHAVELHVSLLVVDEAHCISEWGHYFRPEYREIKNWLTKLPQRPVVAAFTASATAATAKDIIEQLELKSPAKFRQTIIRPNLSLQVTPCATRTIQYLILLRILAHHQDDAIILYGATRAQTETTAELLCNHGYTAKAYHGGLEKEERQSIQRQFLANELRIICATTAFGMGVDKPNIRCVIHLTHPASLEHYYQEVGRAGRDGEPSSCYLLPLPGDGQLQQQILANSYPSFPETEEILLQCLQHGEQKTELTFTQLYQYLQDDISLFEFKQVLEKGENLGWWKADQQQKKIHFVLSMREICRSLQTLARQYNHQFRKLLTIVEYTQHNECRMKQLLVYFEPKEDRTKYSTYRCGKCDVCLPSTTHFANTTEKKNYAQALRHFLARCQQVRSLDLNWSLAGLSLEVLATTTTNLQKMPRSLAGIGRGWREIIEYQPRSRRIAL